MAELKNWYIHYDYGEFIAHGLAYGRASYKFGDGAGVHTSPISSVEIDESGLHIQTRNTLYPDLQAIKCLSEVITIRDSTAVMLKICFRI